MPADREHHKTKRNSFQILIIPQGDAGEKRSITAGLPTIIGAIAIFTVLMGTAIFLVLGYTPLGTIVPITDSEIEQKYGKELVELQTRLNSLSEEMIVMQGYNLKLRTALGENVQADSSLTSTSGTADEDQDSAVSSSNEQQPVSDQMMSVPSADFPDEGDLGPSAASFRAAFPISSPVSGYVSRGFDPAQNHYGIDYAGKRGTIITAAADGYVIFSGWTYDDGNMIIISHGGGYFTVYKHNQSLLTTITEFVKRGQPIALLGNSGKTSYGPHLHFELWKDGKPQNPDNYLIATEAAAEN
jgi:murein DD-endopeptidase MepM/ murein hydrolase activator NlpD